MPLHATIRFIKIVLIPLVALALWPDILWAQSKRPPSGDSTANRATSETDELLRAVQSKVEEVVRSSKGSVVAIARVRKESESREQAAQFRLGFGQPLARLQSPDSPDFFPHGFGAGVVWDDSGTILTAYHVLDDPRVHDYWVWFEGRPLTARTIPAPAQVMAGDPYTDLAVLRVDAKDLRPMARERGVMVEQGQLIVHLGNPRGIARDGRMSAGWGIVSNTHRSLSKPEEGSVGLRENLYHYGNLVELDARMPVGASGGALMDLQGHWIGLTIAPGAVDGMDHSTGWAIPIDSTVERVVEVLKEGKLPAFGFLGIQPEDLSAADRASGKTGALVTAVVRGMPGELAGLREGDVVISVDGQSILGRDSLFRELSRKGPEATIEIQLLRKESTSKEPAKLSIHAKLSKKFVATNRPSYSLIKPETWRGIAIEYTTALPPEMMRFPVRVRGPINQPNLAVLSVEPDSAGWLAGLRPGFAVLSIDGNNVATPEQFMERAAQNQGRPVRLQVLTHAEKLEEVTVASDHP